VISGLNLDDDFTPGTQSVRQRQLRDKLQLFQGGADARMQMAFHEGLLYAI